jgi:hypothetical protein
MTGIHPQKRRLGYACVSSAARHFLYLPIAEVIGSRQGNGYNDLSVQSGLPKHVCLPSFIEMSCQNE